MHPTGEMHWLQFLKEGSAGFQSKTLRMHAHRAAREGFESGRHNDDRYCAVDSAVARDGAHEETRN